MTPQAPTAAERMSLGEVERVVGVWCDQTDPAVFSGADAAVAVERLARQIRRLQAKQAGFAARVDECRSHSRRFASSDDYLARVNGTSRGEAKKAIDTARRLQGCPTAQQAFDQGDLSVSEATEIVSATAVDPSAEVELVSRATQTHDLAEVRERAAKVKEAARRGEDPAVRRARLRAMRCWREFDRDGMREVMASFVKEDWALVAPVVQAYLDAVFAQARREGRRDSIDAYRADAVLAALAAAGEAVGLESTMPGPAKPATTPSSAPTTTTGPATEAAESTGTAADGAESIATTGAADCEADPTATVQPETSELAGTTGTAELADLLALRPERVKWDLVVLVDAIALQRGYPTATETCEIVGMGPINIDLARQILPDAVVEVLVHDLVDIRAHATMTRHQKQALKAALHARDRRCVVPGCTWRRRLQADHRHDYANGGPTSYDNLALLCATHHDQKTHRGARLERVDDEWHWYPPPPGPGEPQPPPGSIPWRAKVGEHLTAFDLDQPPNPTAREPRPETDRTLSFG